MEISLGRCLLAVAAATENLLRKQRRCRFSLVTKKSSGAAATAIEKVAALVAPLCPSLIMTYRNLATACNAMQHQARW